MATINDFYFNYSRKLICHATLAINYNSQTTNFTVGQLIQNAASSPTKTAVIAYDTDNGATGTLDVVNVVGTWANADTIYVGSTACAVVTGTPSAKTTIYTTNQLYSLTTTLFDDALQMDDPSPMLAQTPTAFTLTNGWFIDPTSTQYLKTGSLQTSGWTHPTATDGVRVITFTGSYTGAVMTDIGKAVAYTGDSPNHTGRLLHYDNTLQKWWVRCDNASSTFSNTATAMVVTGGTGSGVISGGTNATGENIWTNIYTLGTLAANTQIYLNQGTTRLVPWWTTGHIDILVLVKEAGSIISSGDVTIFARQYSKLYDHYTAALGSGNQTPIPLATFPDTNNLTGYRQFTGSGGSGTFVVGNLIQKSGDSTVQGVITAVNGPTLTPTITYYLITYPFTDFTNGTAVVQVPSGPTCTAGTPANAGPALLTDIVTFNFSSISRDLNNSNGAQPYNVEIDCAGYTLAQVYQYLKYATRYGAANYLHSVHADAYVAADAAYDPVKQSPFGTFAGGTFFGARGIWLKNVLAADANNFQLIDANGVTQIPPTTITLTVTGLQSGDRVTIFRTTGDNETIDRTIYYSHATNNTAGANTFDVQTAIETDTPSSGVIRVIDNSLSKETRYTYTSWSASRFSGISPVLTTTYEGTDSAYVPFIDEQATGTSIARSTIYAQNRYVLTVVRIVGVVPFKVKGIVSNSNFSVTAIRTADSVYQ